MHRIASMFLLGVSISTIGCKTRLQPDSASVESSGSDYATIPDAGPSQELQFTFSVDPQFEVQFKFCQQNEECPIFTAAAGATQTLSLKAPALYSARLCDTQGQNCKPWQLLLLHPVTDPSIKDSTPQDASSLAFAEDNLKGTSIASLGNGNFITVQYLFTDEINMGTSGLELAAPLPNWSATTCFLNSVLQMIYHSKMPLVVNTIVGSEANAAKDIESALSNDTDRSAKAKDVRNEFATYYSTKWDNLQAQFKSNTTRLQDIANAIKKGQNLGYWETKRSETEDKQAKIKIALANKNDFIQTSKVEYIDIAKKRQIFFQSLQAVLQEMKAKDGTTNVVDKTKILALMESYDRYKLSMQPNTTDELFGELSNNNWKFIAQQRSADEFFGNFAELMNVGVKQTDYNVKQVNDSYQISGSPRDVGLAPSISLELNKNAKSLQDLVDVSYRNPQANVNTSDTGLYNLKRITSPSQKGLMEINFRFPERLAMDNTGSMYKDKTPVIIPDDLTIQVPVVPAGSENPVNGIYEQSMRLKSAIVHWGGEKGGHYVSYIFEADKVLLCSDDKISEVSKKQALEDIKENSMSVQFTRIEGEVPQPAKGTKIAENPALVNKTQNKSLEVGDHAPGVKPSDEPQKSGSSLGYVIPALVFGAAAFVAAPTVIQQVNDAYDKYKSQQQN